MCSYNSHSGTVFFLSGPESWIIVALSVDGVLWKLQSSCESEEGMGEVQAWRSPTELTNIKRANGRAVSSVAISLRINY